MSTVTQDIEKRLAARWPDAAISVTDESHLHAGHAGARPEGESHFHVRIATPALGALSRIERHRAIHAELGDLLTAQIHALRIDAGG